MLFELVVISLGTHSFNDARKTVNKDHVHSPNFALGHI